MANRGATSVAATVTVIVVDLVPMVVDPVPTVAIVRRTVVETTGRREIASAVAPLRAPLP